MLAASKECKVKVPVQSVRGRVGFAVCDYRTMRRMRWQRLCSLVPVCISCSIIPLLPYMTYCLEALGDFGVLEVPA